MVESAPLRQLKRSLAAQERLRSVSEAFRARTGHPGIDQALGGGIAAGRVHEVIAPDVGDLASAAGFGAMLAIRLGGRLVWLREDGAEQGFGLHAAGLHAIGLDPDRLVLARLPDPLALLRAAADVVRCPEIGVAVIELWRDPRVLDLTATRRLALAAERSGVAVLLLRIAGRVQPSAAQTRWSVQSAPSVPLAADAPGLPSLDIELLRQRGRPQTGQWRVEWDSEHAIFRDPGLGERGTPGVPALPGVMVSVPAGRSAGAGRTAASRHAG